MIPTLSKALSFIAVGMLAMAGAATCAQTFPTKPIRIVIPFVAGGASDIVGRLLGQKFQEYFGQPALVENRPGANGALAAEFVAKADPDGHTILVGSIGVFSINDAVHKGALRYRALRDFAPITLAVTTPSVLITRPDFPARSLKEMVEYGRRNPGKLSFCSGGAGSSDHLAAELFKQATGIFAVHVPYRGGAACQIDVMGGQIDFSFQNMGAVTGYIKAGRMKAFAVTTPQRHPQLPQVPTTGEAGLPDVVITTWQAVAAPAKTPPEVVARLNDAAVRALRSPDVQDKLAQMGFDVVAGSADEFGRFMKAEVERWTRVVDARGIKPD